MSESGEGRMDKLIIPKGTIVKIQAIPVKLAEDALAYGNADNFHHDDKKVRKSIFADNWLTRVAGLS